jgi:hypothetical protein
VREFDQLGNGEGGLSRLEDLCTPDMVNHALAPGRAAGACRHPRLPRGASPSGSAREMDRVTRGRRRRPRGSVRCEGGSLAGRAVSRFRPSERRLHPRCCRAMSPRGRPDDRRLVPSPVSPGLSPAGAGRDGRPYLSGAP